MAGLSPEFADDWMAAYDNFKGSLNPGIMEQVLYQEAGWLPKPTSQEPVEPVKANVGFTDTGIDWKRLNAMLKAYAEARKNNPELPFGGF